MAAKQDIKVAIIGGGIAGICLAIALQRRNISYTIYEQSAKFGEIGAGIGFTPNATQAMQICDPAIYDALQRLVVRPATPMKERIWFNGYNANQDPPSPTPMFAIKRPGGPTGVHRAMFLDQLVRLLPPGVSKFNKRLVSLNYPNGRDGEIELRFVDGSSAIADVVLGCDGIKSRVRQIMFGDDHPCSLPSYTHQYAYRALAPMDEAIKALGEGKALSPSMHMGPGCHVMTYPVNQGKTLNIVAFRSSKEDWPDSGHLAKPSRKEDALKDFEAYNSDIQKVLGLIKPDVDVWAIFHTGDHPLPTFVNGRVAVVGDAAHATTPHLGAGAGMCIESCAVLSELLGDERVHTYRDLEVALATYDAIRREPCQSTVQNSQRMGQGYEWQVEGIGGDFVKIEAEINRLNELVGDHDVSAECEEAKEMLGRLLAAEK